MRTYDPSFICICQTSFLYILTPTHQIHFISKRTIIRNVHDFDGSTHDEYIYVNENLGRVINYSGGGTKDYLYVKDETGIVAEQRVSGEKLFYHNDHLGSTTLITNSTGQVIENTFYEPFGGIVSGGSRRYDYEGKEFSDATNDYDFHFRKYDSGLKIFTQPDSLLPNVYDPQQLNRYAFERNNPYRNKDESGHEEASAIEPVRAEGQIEMTLWNKILWQRVIMSDAEKQKELEKYRATYESQNAVWGPATSQISDNYQMSLWTSASDKKRNTIKPNEKEVENKEPVCLNCIQRRILDENGKYLFTITIPTSSPITQEYGSSNLGDMPVIGNENPFNPTRGLDSRVISSSCPSCAKTK